MASQPQPLDSSSSHRVEEWMEKLTVTFEDASSELKIQTMLDLLDACLPICSVDLIDKQIFATVLSKARRLIFQVIDEIREILTDVTLEKAGEVQAKLTMCQLILECWEKCSEFVKKLQKVSVLSIQSFLRTYLEVTKSITNHCMNSEDIYGILLQRIVKELRVLFHKSNKILLSLFTILSDVVVCESIRNDEAEALVQVIGEIGEIASLVNGPEISTLKFLWKGFAKLTVKYESEVKRSLHIKVIDHFRSITKHIITLLSTLLQECEYKVKEKNILSIGLFITILDKLFCTYNDYLTDNILHSSIDLLLELNCYSPPYLHSLKIDETIIKLMNLNVSVVAEPFLKTNLNNDKFMQVFFEYELKRTKNAIGYHLLILDIMKYLTKLPYHLQRVWISEKNSILDIAMSNLNSLHKELCAEKLQIQNLHDLGENPQLLTLYEATLVLMCSLLCHVPASDFKTIELLLLKHLLSGKFWASLLSTDLWCFVNRLGSAQLRYNHTKFLIQLYEQLSQRQTSLETIFLSNLITRLYLKLRDEQKILIINELEHLELSSWNPLTKVLSEKGKSILQKRALQNNIDIDKTFHSCWEKPSIISWNNFMKELKIYESVNIILDERTGKTVSKIWKYVTKVMGDCEGTLSILLCDLTGYLLQISQVVDSDIELLNSILKSIVELSASMPPHLRIKAAYYIRNNVDMFTNSNTSSANWLAKLYCHLLEDNVPWVRQEALESFEQFSQTCSSEDLFLQIMSVIAKEVKISRYVRAYIAHEFSQQLSGFSSLQNYLYQLIENSRQTFQQHVCYEKDDRERDEKLPRRGSDEKFSVTESVSRADLERRVDAVCREIDEITKFKDILGDALTDKLRISFLKILKQ